MGYTNEDYYKETVTAKTDVTLLVLTRTEFNQFFSVTRCPEIKVYFIKRGPVVKCNHKKRNTIVPHKDKIKCIYCNFRFPN